MKKNDILSFGGGVVELDFLLYETSQPTNVKHCMFPLIMEVNEAGFIELHSVNIRKYTWKKWDKKDFINKCQKNFS